MDTQASTRESMDEVIKNRRKTFENDFIKELGIITKPISKIRQNLTEHALPVAR